MSDHGRGDKIQEIHVHQDCISSCFFIQNDGIIVTASHDKTITFWNSSTGEKLNELIGHQNSVTDCCTQDPEGEILLSTSWDKTVRTWDTNAGKQLWMGCHESLAISCDFQHSRQQQPSVVVVGLEDGYYHMWDTRMEGPVKSVKAHSNSITRCRVSPDGRNLCTCSMDQTAAVWDVRTHSRLLNLSGHVNVVSSCAFSRNSHFLVTCSWDKTLQVYDVAIGNYRMTGPVALLHHDGCVSACDFSEDGTLLVSCGYDMQVNVWNMNSYQLINSYKGHEAWIKDVKFGENKKWAVSCDKNGVVRVWNTESGSQHYNKLVKYADPNTVELIKCAKCGKMFSPAYNNSQVLSSNGADATDNDNGRDTRSSSAEQHQLMKVCVFCRLRDPSRTLDQVSNHFLQQ